MTGPALSNTGPLRPGLPGIVKKLSIGQVGCLTLVVLVIIAGVAVTCAAPLVSRRTVTATVSDKERVCDRDTDGTTDCKYLIFTDQGTFKITDSLLIGRFDSSDVYGRFRRDTTYRFDVYGWRMPWASEYPNVASNPVQVQR